MAVERKAEAWWEGDLFGGRGRVDFDSGALPETRINWRARAEDPGNVTSPEELLAAAHASCFSMAFANNLAQADWEPQKIHTHAAVKFQAGTGVTGVKLAVTATVPGIDPDAFNELAHGAKDGCPISQALAGNVPIELEATLQ
jgi:lipoyl-dependent peroxiredoxin